MNIILIIYEWLLFCVHMLLRNDDDIIIAAINTLNGVITIIMLLYNTSHCNI